MPADRSGLAVALTTFPAFYAASMAAVGQLRAVHLGLAIAVPVAAIAHSRTRAALRTALPLFLIVYGFDIVKLLAPRLVGAGRVLGCELRRFEIAIFGVGNDRSIGDVFAEHHSTAFDLFFAIPYGGYIAFAAAHIVWLFQTDRSRMHHFMWTLGVLHVLGFAAWLALPAAPPWYVRGYGCTIDMTVAPSAAALLRVDTAFGIHYFQSFYSQGATVFGAMPSLHCAVPMAGLATAWRSVGWPWRAVHAAYVGWMIVASVYLDHHWVLDGLAGWLVAIAGYRLTLGMADRLSGPDGGGGQRLQTVAAQTDVARACPDG